MGGLEQFGCVSYSVWKAIRSVRNAAKIVGGTYRVEFNNTVLTSIISPQNTKKPFLTLGPVQLVFSLSRTFFHPIRSSLMKSHCSHMNKNKIHLGLKSQLESLGCGHPFDFLQTVKHICNLIKK